MNTQITPPIGAPLSEERISFGEALRQLYAIYRRRQWVIWPTAAAVILIGAAYIFQITPTYTATASVMLDTRQGEVVDIEAVRAGLPVDTASVETEVGIIRSRSLLRQVAEQLDLADTPQFNPSLRRTSELQRFTDSVKGVFPGILRPAGALRAPPPAPPA
ncbi:MAG: hypothetical protein HXY25_09015, partial [Alphaproteobacteria bacterium]|nr:hypothetical protein [Alphaproteobacteria bacterium]